MSAKIGKIFIHFQIVTNLQQSRNKGDLGQVIYFVFIMNGVEKRK
jgi:hypothetical protein